MANSHYVDPQVRGFLDQFAANYGEDYIERSIDELRALYLEQLKTTAKPLPAGCEDGRFDVPGLGGPVACRYFKPQGEGPFPVLIYFLGGTFIYTTLDHVGAMPPETAMLANCIVVVPLHRMPPENRFPAAFDDCFSVYRWLTEHAAELGGDQTRIALMGESSGATLAAAVCIDALEAGVQQPVLQVLAEPLLDQLAETASLNEFTYVLSKTVLRQEPSAYFGDAPPERRASPLRAKSLKGVAPAYVITADLDPLRDEALAFVARLRTEGVLVAHRHHDGQVHAFFSMFDQLTQAKIAFHECCAVLALAFSGGFVPPPASPA